MAFYTEGKLQFFFPNHWGVRAYDDHTYYKGLSGIGLKGVDFIAIDPEQGGHLYIIEVKNYRTRINKSGRFEATLKTPEVLAETLNQKFHDTLRAIRAINQYYQRSWWFRKLSLWLLRSHRFYLDRVFWSKAFQLSESLDKTTFVLWIEVEGENNNYLEEVEKSLKNTMVSPTVNVLVENSQQTSSFPVQLIKFF